MAAASAPPSTAAAPASIKELMATFLARDMVDGEEIFVGTNLPVIRAGVLLAHLHHGPNMRVMVAHTRTNLYHTPVMEYFELLTDWRGARWAEAYFNDNEIVMYQKSRRDSVFFVGALQIDPFGNSNLIGLGKDRRRLALRGPGAIATTTNASHVRRFYLFVNEHSPRVFVPRCDFVSTVGWAGGGADGGGAGDPAAARRPARALARMNGLASAPAVGLHIRGARLEVRRLSKVFAGTRVVDDVSFAVEGAEWLVQQ